MEAIGSSWSSQSGSAIPSLPDAGSSYGTRRLLREDSQIAGLEHAAPGSADVPQMLKQAPILPPERTLPVQRMHLWDSDRLGRAPINHLTM